MISHFFASFYHEKKFWNLKIVCIVYATVIPGLLIGFEETDYSAKVKQL